MSHIYRGTMIAGLFAHLRQTVAVLGPLKIDAPRDVVGVTIVSTDKLLWVTGHDLLIYELAMGFGLTQQGIKPMPGVFAVCKGPEISQTIR